MSYLFVIYILIAHISCSIYTMKIDTLMCYKRPKIDDAYSFADTPDELKEIIICEAIKGSIEGQSFQEVDKLRLINKACKDIFGKYMRKAFPENL